MKYTIYQITNKLNNKIYIGKHQTENIEDGYFGSGLAIKEAVKKYGKVSFEKEILFVFDTEEEMNEKERELVTEDFVKRNDTYNLGLGGEGGPHFKGKKHGSYMKEIYSSDEFKQSVSEGLKKYFKTNHPWNKGVSPSDETKQKMREAKLGKKRTLSEESREKIKKSRTGKKHSDETKQKMREAKLGKKRIFSEEHKRNISEAMKKKGPID